MVFDLLDNAQRYESLHPAFPAAFAFLRRADVATLADGRHEIDGTRAFAIIGTARQVGPKGAKLEAHRKYIDIRFMVDGDEVVGWQSLDRCADVAIPYDPATDLIFFRNRPDIWLPLPPKRFAIFFPTDAHAPLAGEGDIRRVVVIKIAV
jgi:biofilm protein TabA